MDSPDTVVDALRLLRSEGYEVEFQLVDGSLQCNVDDLTCPASDAVVERLYRFEGSSDPGDEMVVFGLRDPVSGRRGVLASGFGPAADPDLLDHLTGLASRFGRDGDGVSRDLSGLRESYQRAGLRRIDLAADPMTQFERWWDEWVATEPYDPAACVLATADASGRPSARFVLCRAVGPTGFAIYTNQQSAKARDLEHNPHAALTFGWLDLARQVRVEGPVSVIDPATADAYWSSRPRGSQIGAWASAQSTPVADRAKLDARTTEVEQRFTGPDGAELAVTRPPHWGGYLVGVDRIEFWQGQPNRLHDRFEYRAAADGAWTITRLSP